MHIHILGICGTFMGGLAVIARQLGHQVTGSDSGVYPPMSTLLEEQGIKLSEGYDPSHLQPAPDLVVVGNAMSRGNAAVEYMLNHRLPFTSGPQWLSDHVLQSRCVLAVAGTHGKTTTSSLLAWMLECGGLNPGFLIGGVPVNFGVSARVTDSDFFVIEADEYDSAFFDKRSKFVHYRPTMALLNNLEFDHADIFDDLAAIRKQFHHLVRTVPSNGRLVVNGHDAQLKQVLDMGCWTDTERYLDATRVHDDAVADTSGTHQTWTHTWSAKTHQPDYSAFTVYCDDEPVGDINWSLIGDYNMHNALGAIALANGAGVEPGTIVDALRAFAPPKRRLELKAERDDILVYDDFAHHPTAIAGTITALRARYPNNRLIAVFEPRSNSMKLGSHQTQLQQALNGADLAFVLQPPGLGWELSPTETVHLVPDTDQLLNDLVQCIRSGDRVCVMSNGSFNGLTQRLADVVST